MVPKIRQAVILAGGRGVRMMPLTKNTPKPMIPILGKPFLHYIIENLRENGITDIILLVGYLHDKIENYFGDGSRFGVRIRYSNSGIKADTGTRIRSALPLLQNNILLLYGDNFWPLHLRELEWYLHAKKVIALVTVYGNRDNYTKNNIVVSDNGIVTAYDKTRKDKNLSGVDIGYFILPKTALKKIPKTNVSFEATILPELIKKKQLVGYVTHHKYYGLSNPDRIKKIIEYFRPKKVCFLDRDGVINKRPRKAMYVTQWSQFIMLPGVFRALQILSKHNFKLFIITNQSGIARGLMTKGALTLIHTKLKNLLKPKGIKIEAIYVCPHGWNDNCFCRKPNPGLLFQAASEYGIDLFSAYMIGDDDRDLIAGKLAGCKTVLVSNSQYKNSNQPDIMAKSLYDAARKIVRQNP